MDNTERIEAKKVELLNTFATLPEEKLKVAADLIAQAAFLAVTLEDLAEIIGKEGMTEDYQNGANQSGRKISSNAKMYASLIGKYNTIVTKLLTIVPAAEKPQKALSEFEVRKLHEEQQRMAFSEANRFIAELENRSPAIAKEIQDIRIMAGWDVFETAKILRDRGYTIEGVSSDE